MAHGSRAKAFDTIDRTADNFYEVPTTHDVNHDQYAQLSLLQLLNRNVIFLF